MATPPAAAAPVSEAGLAFGPEPTQGVPLARELSELLTELAGALHKHAIYPPGHPLREKADVGAFNKLTALLAERRSVAIGVGRRQLVIDGATSGASNALIGDLAGKLNRHQIGGVKLDRGVTRVELSDMLSLVGLEPQRDAKPLGAQPELLDARWANIRLLPVTFDRLELLDGSDEERAEAAEVWAGLARVVLADGGANGKADVVMDPALVARAIDGHAPDRAFDESIADCLIEFARQAKTDGSPAAAMLQHRVSTLIGLLQPDTLTRLLKLGGDSDRRRRLVLDASQGMTVNAVIALVQAAAAAEGQTISHALVRMLAKLAAQAETAAGARGAEAKEAFGDHIERLVGSWSLADPNPEGYLQALERMARHEPAAPSDAPHGALGCEPERVVAMALELDVASHRVAVAVATLLGRNGLSELLDLLDAAPAPAGAAATAVRAQVFERDPLPAQLAAPRMDEELVRRLVLRSGTAAAEPLLDALAQRHERTRHERLLNYLAMLGPAAAPIVGAHLAQAPAALARELLVCLGRLAPRSAPPEAIPYTTHAQPAVRREAVRLLLGFDETREETLATALVDPDERVVYTGLQAAQGICTPELAAVIRQRMDRGDLADGVVRATAVRVVASDRAADALPWLLRRTVVLRRLLRRARIAPATPEVLAALTAIATHWADDGRAAQALELARRSADASVSAAVRRDVQPHGER